MSKEHDLPSDSDDDDEDYVPGGAESEVGSEVESEGEAESGPEDENNENLKTSEPQKKGNKRGSKNRVKSRKKPKKTAVEEPEEEVKEVEKLSEEDEKKRADSLWADFMKDTPVTSRPKSKDSVTTSLKETSSSPFVAKKQPATTEKVKITKLFEFAGEEVKVETEVAADSAEARLSLSSSDSKSDTLSSSSVKGRGIRRVGGLSGISSVLGQLGKKAKISTLEKSKLDWDSYKKEKNIEEEISTHNKGKDGYLEKQDFLQRADIRQFEIEKQLRSSRRSSR